MDSISPSKRPASPIITRSKLRGVLIRLAKKAALSQSEVKIMKDAKRRLGKCEETIANNATERLLDTGWKFETEINVKNDVVLVYYRTREEGLVFLKKRGILTTEVINLVGCNILKDTLGKGRSLNYMMGHGIKQRILTNGWTPEHSHYVRDQFKGMIELEDTSNISMSVLTRFKPAAVTREKSIGLSATAGSPVKPKRASAFKNITPGTPSAKRAKTGTCLAAASFSHITM